MTIDVGKVAMIPISSIEVSERARQEMGDLESLEGSLKESGLIQPLAVQKIGSEKYKLLAGERRYMILLSNKVTTIPARIYERELTPLEKKVIEKAENFYRKDMEYWEYDALVLEIHSLEQEVHGKKAVGGAAQFGGHGTKETAEMFGMAKSSVSEAIKRAEARQAYPDLFEHCKTQKDATKVIKKIDEAAVKQAIADKIEREKEEGTTTTRLANSFIIGDFFEGVKKIPKGVIHLIEIDPPYAIDLHHIKRRDGESQYIKEDYNEITSDSYEQFLKKLLKECYRVMADHSWLLLWFAMEPWFETVFQQLLSAGFSSTRMCNIWTKGHAGQSMNPDIKLASSYETFFYAWKGRPALNRAGRGNEFHFPPVPPQNKTHPTERPVELMQEIYDTFAFPGSRILIPFLGSGSGLIAANELGMSAVGFELSKSYRDSFLVRVHGK